MKKIALTILSIFLMVSGETLAQQFGEEKKGSSMQEMMQQMMKQKQGGQGSMHGMGDMGGMMGMMKMMEQCGAMMKSHDQSSKDSKETSK